MPPAEAASAPRGSLVRATGLSAALLAAGKALTLGAVLALSAVMPIAAFGEFMYARGLVLFLGPFMALGLTVTAMRCLPAFERAGDLARAAGFVRTLTRAALATSCAAAAAAALAAALWAGPDRALAIQVALLGLPGFALLAAQTQAARALGRVALAYGPPSLGQPLAFAGGALALWAAVGPPSPVGAAALLAATMLGAALAQHLGLQRLPALRATPRAETRAWLGEALPLTLSLAAQGVAASGPLLLLGLFAEGPALGVFGLYQAAMQGLLVFNTAILGSANPRLSALVAGGERAAAERLMRRARLAAGAVSAMGGLAAWALVMAFGGLAQPAFASAPATLALLLASVALGGLSGPLGHVLVMEDRRGWEVATQAAAAALTVMVALAAIPALGLLGAALATFAAALLRAVLVHALVHGRLGWRA